MKVALTIDKQNELFEKDLKFITESIEETRKNKKKLIILTHHSPTSRNTLEVDERGSVIE